MKDRMSVRSHGEDIYRGRRVLHKYNFGYLFLLKTVENAFISKDKKSLCIATQ